MPAAQFEQALVEAIKSGDTIRISAIRSIKSSLKNEQIKLGHDLTELEVLRVVQREAKQRRDSITAYQTAARPDLVQEEQAELSIIEQFLPAEFANGRQSV